MNHHIETSMPWIASGDAPPLPADRDRREIISQGVADPLYDIDIFPLTLVNSRIFAFIYRASEADLRRILPDSLQLEDDLVEFWYAVHDNTSMGPYNEIGATVAVSCRGSDGLTYHAGYYPYMWLTQDIPTFAGHEPYGFGKKMAYIVCLEHGGRIDDGYSGFGNDYFNFVLERRGYLIHTATGRYDDEPLREKPVFYGDARYGRLNLKLLTDPSLRTTRWELLYLPALVSREHAVRVARPELEGKPRMEIKPETIRTASASAIRSWAFQATPFDNVAAMLPVRELIGLMSFSFDLTLPGAQTIWTKTIERTEEELADLMFATPYRYTMRHRFPKPLGA